MIGALMSALHLITMVFGLAAVWERGRALRLPQEPATRRRLFLADNVWGFAALFWLGTGLARAFLGIEKGWQFYMFNGFFWVKMGLFAVVIALELLPMITLIRWRMGQSGGPSPQTLARINDVEIGVTLLIPFAAAAMARALWMF
jgi:putative membrane protein